MKALILNDGSLRVGDVADPTPEPGHLLVKTLACTICASDHHMVHHGHRLAGWSREHGGPFDFDPQQDLVLGHEICAEVVERGADTTGAIEVGQRVVTQAPILHAGGLDVLGYSNRFPGGFSEYLVMSESMVLPVPDNVSDDVAALAEPLSVGMQYTRIADPQPNEAPIVIGCGAIGLAMVAALKSRGHGPVIAVDYSPMRRATAAAAGADVVVDPAEEVPFDAWRREAPRGSACLVFECVGAPGVLDSIFTDAPYMARVIVAGQCLDDDTIFAGAAHTKALNVQFGGMPLPVDFEDSLAALAAGTVDGAAWITGHASLDDAVQAFADSTDTERHTRIAVVP